ncbi:hypothetical protein CBM2633_B60064 [Cupriavidus taiwanensis]|nr:hypothetical protein CBM2633_B60064 [Cupriavidus taiwanensis]
MMYCSELPKPTPPLVSSRRPPLQGDCMRIRKQTDFYSGLMFIILGLSFSFVARGYSMGTAARMAAGLFPVLAWHRAGAAGRRGRRRIVVAQERSGPHGALGHQDAAVDPGLGGAVRAGAQAARHGAVGAGAGAGVVDGQS